jgi:sec-independent protein translocase protein TatA
MLAEIFSPDILIVLGIVAVLFGGSKLPQLARSLGSAKGEFEKGLKEGEKAKSEAKDDAKPAEVKAVEASSEPVIDTTGTVVEDTPSN